MPLHRHRPRTIRRPIEGRLQEMAQQGHHPHEHRGIGHRWVAAVDATGLWRLPSCQWNQRYRGNRCGDRRGQEEALGLQPGQIAANRIGIAVALAMEFAQQGRCPLRQLAAG